MSKKVMFILIDSFMPHVFSEAKAKGLVPTLVSFAGRGAFWDDCVSVFPTMSLTVDASFLTGSYPDVHKIPGLVWYFRNEQRIVNYYSSFKAAWSIGITQCVEDMLVNINDKHLNMSIHTLFEELEKSGKTVGSINFGIHRGLAKHTIRKPGLLKWLLYKMPPTEVSGPSICSLGKYITSYRPSLPWKINQSVFKKYGLNDSFAMDIVCQMIQTKTLPDFTLLYLPDNDFSNEKNPDNGVRMLEKVDQQIARLLENFGGMEEALKQCRFIVTGDHGQSKIHSETNAMIQIEEVLKGFKFVSTKFNKSVEHDVVVCNNSRMCYFYPLHEEVLEPIVNRLTNERKRVDIIAWKHETGVCMQFEGKKLFFTPANEEPKPSEGKLVIDPYGRKWVISGEIPNNCTLQENQPNLPAFMTFTDYPDLFSRLYGALYANEGQVVVATSIPGYEFVTKNDPDHRGGATHGSLHKLDSLVPLIITDEAKETMHKPRIVDLKHYIINTFSQTRV